MPGIRSSGAWPGSCSASRRLTNDTNVIINEITVGALWMTGGRTQLCTFAGRLVMSETGDEVVASREQISAAKAVLRFTLWVEIVITILIISVAWIK
jgi:hypothetical protein